MKFEIQSQRTVGACLACLCGALFAGVPAGAETVWYADGPIDPYAWTLTDSWSANPDGTGGNPSTVQGSGDVFDANGYIVNSDGPGGVTDFEATLRLSGRTAKGGAAGRLQLRSDSVSVDALEVTGREGVNFVVQVAELASARLTIGKTIIDNQLRPRADGKSQTIHFGALSGTGSIALVFAGEYRFAAGDTSAFTGSWILKNGTTLFEESGAGVDRGFADFNAASLAVDAAEASVILENDVYIESLRLTGLDTRDITMRAGDYTAGDLNALTSGAGSPFRGSGIVYVGQRIPRAR